MLAAVGRGWSQFLLQQKGMILFTFLVLRRSNGLITYLNSNSIWWKWESSVSYDPYNAKITLAQHIKT
jgi:hypothetical protein